MIYGPTLAIGRWGESPTLDRARLLVWLAALVETNVLILRALPRFPRLYQSGVRYRSPEDQCNGCDLDDPWADCLAAMEQGYVDCEDAAAWLAAERRVRDGLDARAEPEISYDAAARRQRIHVVALVGGLREDPSVVLGM